MLAKLTSMLVAIQLASQEGSCRKVRRCTDSRADLRALKSMTAKVKLITECHNKLISLVEECTVELLWTPGTGKSEAITW